MKELNIGGFDNVDGNITSPYQEEMNTLKIDKLSNRVTIISIIIPCIILAILVFGYFNMQETVIDVNLEKQTKIMEITKQFAEKTNALNVEIANLQSMLEKKFLTIDTKISKLDAAMAKVSSKKADKTTVKKEIAKINSNNSKYKNRLDKIEKTGKKNLALINSSKTEFDKDISIIDNKLNTKLTKIDEYENSVAITMKNLSILQKRYDEFKKNSLTSKTFEKELKKITREFDKKLEKLEKRISASIKANQARTVEKKIIQEKKISPQSATSSSTRKTSENKAILEEPIEE